MITQHKKKTHDLSLKDIIKEERVKNICRKFIDKLQINNTSSEPA